MSERKAYRDPTCEAIERLQKQLCHGCSHYQWNPFNRVAWCDHPKWIGRELQRPSTAPDSPRMHRCTDHPQFRDYD